MPPLRIEKMSERGHQTEVWEKRNRAGFLTRNDAKAAFITFVLWCAKDPDNRRLTAMETAVFSGSSLDNAFRAASEMRVYCAFLCTLHVILESVESDWSRH
mgnify:CR=1 FL=1